MRTEKFKTAIPWVLVLLFVAAPALGFSAGSAAGEGGPGRHGGGDEFMGHRGILSELNLSRTQKHDIALILKDHRKDIRECFTDLRAARKNLFTAVRSPEYNEEAIRKAAREAARFEEEMAVLRARIISEIQKVLTPEQKSKIAAKRAKFIQKFDQRVQKRFDRVDSWINKHAAQP